MSRQVRIYTLFCTIGMASLASGAEFELHPSLTVSQEYTDNVFETTSNRKSDYITRALPGLTMLYRAPSMTSDLNYQFDYRHYANKNHTDEFTHLLAAKGHVIAVKDLFFLNINDDFQRVSLDATRDIQQESLFLNQSDRNVATAEPYIMLHPSDRATLKVAYRFTDTRYFDSPAINKTDHTAMSEATYALTSKLDLNAGYSFTRELSDLDNFNQHQGYGGFRYEYADKSYIFGQGGNTWTNYQKGRRLNSSFWNAGIKHQADTITASVTTGKHYIEDPLRNILQETFVSGALEKRFNSGSVSISPVYSEYVNTDTDRLQTRKYGATVQGQYEFGSSLTGTTSFTAEKYEQPLLGSYTRRFLASTALSYLIADQLTLTLAYTYVDYYSPGIAADNRHVNRGIIELKKVF